MHFFANNSWFYPAQVNSHVRLLHACPNVPAVNIYANNRLLAKNLKYKEFSQYFTLPAGTYRFNIYSVERPDVPIISEDLEIIPNCSCTIALSGMSNNLLLLRVPERKVPIPTGKTMIRFVHLSPDAPSVDIALPNGKILFKDVEYTEIENYIPVEPIVYTLQARTAGTNNIILTIPNINLKENRFYTIYAVGLLRGNPPLQALIPLDGISYINV